MLLCDQPIIEKWSPDFSSSGLPNPVWTRVKYGGTVLCKSLEWTEWSTNPVQVEICDACGTVGCASGGYVHLSAFGDLVLLTVPRDVPNADLRGYPATAIEKFGSIAFPVGVWRSFQIAASEVPPFESLAGASGRALCDAWAVGQTRPKVIAKLVPMLRACLLAADSLEVADAIRLVEHWIRWFEDRAAAEIHGHLATLESTGAKIEKLYFDGPGTDDWVALAQLDNSFLPALSPNHIFVPDE